jgi:hypothetical protein
MLNFLPVFFRLTEQHKSTTTESTMSGARTSGGLMCSHGSQLDCAIPRPPAVRRALPDCIRKKIKGSKREPAAADNQGPERLANTDVVYQAGAGSVVPRGDADGEYRAGSQRNFLKRGTGKPMSERASRLAQMSHGAGVSRGVYQTEGTRRVSATKQEAKRRSRLASSGAMMMGSNRPEFSC